MKYILIFLILSCSSLKKTMLTTASSGAVIGGAGGRIFSPNDEDKNKNTFLWGGISALLGAGIGYLIHKDPNKEKREKELLLLKEKNKELPLFEFSEELKHIKPKVNFAPIKKYQVPLKKLPRALKGKVKKQYIIEYQTKEQTIQHGNRTIHIAPFKAWENIYE